MSNPEPDPSPWALGRVVAELRAERQRWRQAQARTEGDGARELPSREVLRHVVQQLCGALFPMRLGPADLRQDAEDYFVGHTLDAALHALNAQVRLELRLVARHEKRSADDVDAVASSIVRDFAAGLPQVRRLVDSDVLAAYEGDPAARSVDEIVLCYPGITAIIHHRLAHQLYRLGVPLLARVVAEIAHGDTGIDIHPGAQILGERVRLYQAVTLGAKSFPTADDGTLRKGLPRHPIVEDEVVIYAGATILGRITIGRGSVIGGNVWLTHSVPPGSQVSQAQSKEGAQPLA
jgi:serine O-acetyltransferase